MQPAVKKRAYENFQLHGWMLPSVFFLPSFMMTVFLQSSMAAGLIISITCLTLYILIKIFSFDAHRPIKIVPRLMILWLLLCSSIFIHSMIVLIIGNEFSLYRFVSGYLVFIWVAGMAAQFALMLPRVSEDFFSRKIDVVMAFLCMNALLGLTGFGLLPGGTYKQVGIFPEPSHFALILAPVLSYYCVAGRRYSTYALMFFFAWGVIVQNLTVLFVCSLSLLLILRFDLRLIIVSVAIIPVVLFSDSDYFVSRIAISTDSSNISVLVLLKGWEAARMLLENTNGLGAGFQQFGVKILNGEISERLNSLTDGDLNRFDGGSTAAKIVGEFGYIGIIFITIYIIGFLFALIWLRRMNRTRTTGGGVFLVCAAFTFIVELFARGVGYFSPTFFLALSAFFLLGSSGNIVITKKHDV